MNCWEFMRCEKDPECPAYPDHGRRCARVAGTLCGGRVQGVFALKLTHCRQCDFYRSTHYHPEQN